MRDVAGWDYDKARRVARWPLREVLLAQLEHAKDRALEAFRWEAMQHAVTAPWTKKESGVKPPQIPDILKR